MGSFWGVVLGAWWPSYCGWGSYIGGFLGFFVGLTLQFLIKQQVTARHANLREQPMAQVPTPASVKPTPEVHNVLVPASAVTPASTVVHASAGSSAGASPPPQFVPSYQPSLPYVASRSTRPSGLANPQLIETPNVLDAAFKAVKDWLLGGNTSVRVALVILFIGLSFLARYVAALMYLVVFAALRLYALSCVLALMQNSQALVVAAFAGGFAVPFCYRPDRVVTSACSVTTRYSM